MRAASVEALTPFPLASSANCFFHASKPAAVLPHCAAPALLVIHTSDTRTATATVLTCRPSVIPNSFHALASDETLARHPCRDEASSPALALFKIRVLHFGDGLLRSPSGSLKTVSARVFFHKDIFVPRTRAPGYSRNGRGQTPNGGGAHGSPNQRAHVRKGHQSGAQVCEGGVRSLSSLLCADYALRLMRQVVWSCNPVLFPFVNNRIKRININ